VDLLEGRPPAMGNAVDATQRFACGHTDRARLQQSLLADRLSAPTAEMVEALLFLQGHTVRLQQYAELGPDAPPPTLGGVGRRPLVLLAAGYCILLGYNSENLTNATTQSMGRQGNPELSDHYSVAFEGAISRPEEFLQDLLKLRAQTVSSEKVMQLLPLTRREEVDPDGFCGRYGEVLQHLALFLRAAVDCAEIYDQIRERAARGLLDRRQADQLLEGTESDQRNMINAMGSDPGRSCDVVEAVS